MQKKNTILKRGLAVLLSLLVLMAAAPLAFAEDAGCTHNIYLDFCEGHGELAEKLAEYLETAADGTVVPVTVTSETGTLSEVKYLVRTLLRVSGVYSLLDFSDQLFLHNGEDLYDVGLKPLCDYDGKEDYDRENYTLSDTITVNDNDTLFVCWRKPARNVSVTIAAPVCGTEVQFVNHYAAGGGNASPTTSPAPEITVTGDAVLFRSPYHDRTDGYWTDNINGGSYDSNYTGYLNGVTFYGGNSYLAAFELEAAFGYYLSDSTEVLVNGSKPLNRSPFVASVEAVHVQEGAEISVTAAATCTSPGAGSCFCTGCNKTVNVVIPATGHEYGDPVWTWSDDCSLAVFSLGCKNCDGETVRVAAIDVAKTDATATEDGEIVYTASVTVDGETYTDSKTVVLPAAGTPDEPDDPAADPAEPTEPQGDSLCKWCGEPHTGAFGSIIQFLHSILYFFAHLFGVK